MPLINSDTPMIYTGVNECDAVYQGSALVWQNEVIVQETITVTEGKLNVGAKGSVDSYGFGVENEWNLLACPAAGSRSPSSVNGRILYAAYTDNGQSTFNLSIPVAVAAITDVFDRVYVQGYGWIDATEFVVVGVCYGGKSMLWGTPPILDGAFSLWNGSGSSTLIFEYTQ